jgi:hypothetical protein
MSPSLKSSFSSINRDREKFEKEKAKRKYAPYKTRSFSNQSLDQNKYYRRNSEMYSLSDTRLFLEKPYRPQATLSWLQNLQSKMDDFEGQLQWITEVNSHPHGYQIEECIFVFRKYFTEMEEPPIYFLGKQSLKGTTFQNIVDWTHFIQKIFLFKDNGGKCELIQKHQVGSILSQCARILSDVSQEHMHSLMPEIAGQINIMSEKVMSILISDYFFKRDHLETGLKIPFNKVRQLNPLVEEIFNTIGNESGDHTRSIILGFDSASQKVYTARSGRLYAIDEREKSIWKNIQDKWENQNIENDNTGSACHFVNQKIERITISILLGAGERFWHLCSKTKNQEHRNIGDINFIRGVFHDYIEGLYQNNSSIKRKVLCDSLY